VRLVTGHDATVQTWVFDRFCVRTGGRPCEAWGNVDNEGVLRGAFVLTHEHNHTMELHVYGETSNDTFRAMFRNVFLALGCYRLQIRTSRKNKVIRKAAPKFGFTFEGISRHFYGPGEDALCFYMTPEHCRWLGENKGPWAASSQVQSRQNR
jgi:RimJ/RimL family protein N-acetyltransferase